MRVDNVALVGTMSYEKGPFAFFDGSSSSYRKVAKILDEVAGFKVLEVHTGHVKLQSGTNMFELRVGMQLRREEQGPWKVTERDLPREENRFASGSSSFSRTGSGSSSSAPSGRSDGDFPRPDQPGLDGGPVVIMQQGDEGGPIVMSLGAAPGDLGTNGPPADAGGGLDNDVLRRLMERRAQELNR